MLVLLGDWDGLGYHLGAVLSVKHKVRTTLQYGVCTAKWFLQITQRTLSFSFMMKISLLMVTLRTGISVFTRINFHGSKIIKILLQLYWRVYFPKRRSARLYRAITLVRTCGAHIHISAQAHVLDCQFEKPVASQHGTSLQILYHQAKPNNRWI